MVARKGATKISFSAYLLTIRSIRSKIFYNIRVLKNFEILTGKHLCWGLLLINFQAFGPAIFLNREPKTGVFL